MQFSEIARLKFFLEFRFEALQLGYIVCQYDQIIHVEDYHQQIFTSLFDIQQMIRLTHVKSSLIKNESIRWYQALSDCLNPYTTFLNLHTRFSFPSCTKPFGWSI